MEDDSSIKMSFSLVPGVQAYEYGFIADDVGMVSGKAGNACIAMSWISVRRSLSAMLFPCRACSFRI